MIIFANYDYRYVHVIINKVFLSNDVPKDILNTLKNMIYMLN